MKMVKNNEDEILLMEMIYMKPDTVCGEYAENKGMKRLTLQTYEEEETEADMMLIEEEADALEFLGEVLIAQAKYKKDCSFSIGPRTSGNVFFTKNSTHGIYIHRLPCVDDPNFKMAKP